MAETSIWKRGDQEVSLVRMYVMRAGALLGAVALGVDVVPDLIWPDPVGRGMITSILGGLCVLGALFAIRYPLKMLPIFLFEFTWKFIWLLRFGLPQWMAGGGSPRLAEDMIDIGLFIPWGYVWRHYVVAPSERWR